MAFVLQYKNSIFLKQNKKSFEVENADDENIFFVKLNEKKDAIKSNGLMDNSDMCLLSASFFTVARILTI